MQPLDLDALPLVGALDFDRTAEGLGPRRSPAWARPQIIDPAMDIIVRMPAGVRLEFTTTSRRLELDVMLTTLEIGGGPPIPAAFDVVVNGALQSSVTGEGGTRILVGYDRSIEVIAGSPSTVALELPGDGGVAVEVWLPHTAVVELRGARIDEGTTLEPLRRRRRRWVHHGSSISHCIEAPSPTQTWPALAAAANDVELLNLAYAGQAVLDPHVARTIRDLDADFISAKIGINIVNGDLMRERVFVPALHGFLDTIREGHPRTPLVLATPICCPTAEDHPGPTIAAEDGIFTVAPRPEELSIGSLSLTRIRELMTQIVETRRDGGDENLHLVDGLGLFGPDDVGDLPDGLHPNPAGYRRMAERFSALVFTSPGPFAV